MLLLLVRPGAGFAVTLRLCAGLFLMMSFALSGEPALCAPAAKSPVIWFCPLDPLVRPQAGYGGAPGYMDLFKVDAPWKRAAAHVSVFKIYPQWIGQATDADLRVQFADLKRRQIALALEFGPLTAGVDQGGEGFGGQRLLAVVRRIKSDGGDLRYLAMDEPMFFGTVHSKHPLTVSEMAQNAAANIREMWTEFPEVQVGDIEPLVSTSRDGLSDAQLTERYGDGVDQLAQALDKPLAFFDSDLDWNSSEYPARLAATAKMAHDRNVPFGIIFDGDGGDSDDASWLQSARRHMADSEAAVGPPDIAIFQSWHAHPEKLLPETDRDAFTSLIDDYFGTRTHLSALLDHGVLCGRLLAKGGAPVSGALIEATLHAINSPGVLAEYTATGTIPTGARMAVIGIRVNTEGAAAGDCNVQVVSMRYEASGQASVVRTFSDATDGDAWPSLATSRDGGATAAIGNGALNLTASPSQTEILNSTPFPITASGTFRFVVQAKIPSASARHGNFVLVFLGEKTEMTRAVIPFEDRAVTLPPSVTLGDGRWYVAVPSGVAYQADCRYDGDASHWPSNASTIRR